MEITARQIAVLQVGPGQDGSPQVTVHHVDVLQSRHAEVDTGHDAAL